MCTVLYSCNLYSTPLNLTLLYPQGWPRSPMAPNLAAAQHELIGDMIASRSLTYAQIADAAGCSSRSVKSISKNLRYFSGTRAPSNGSGRPRYLSPPIADALRQYLLEHPGRYLDEQVVFLWDEFKVMVSNATISRSLTRMGWSKKVARRVAQERNADLRDFYLHNLSAYETYHLIYIDESGCDKRIGFRRTGWSPLGVTPVQVARFHRGQRYHILPAYCQDGILLSRVFQGSTDSAVFEDFFEQLLSHCGRWPEPKSVLIMDNASFHHSTRCHDSLPEVSNQSSVWSVVRQVRSIKGWVTWSRVRA
jgi:transposase